MSAPKEPGKADSAGNGPADASQRPPARTGRITDTGEAPPWQRGGPTRPPAPARAAEGGVAGRPPGADERARRFASGTAAPAATGSPSGPQQGQAKPPAPPVKPAVKAPPPAKPNDDAYASELPDLSEPAQRRPQVRRTQVSAGPRGPLRASMQIRRIDPWSALKVSLLLSTALFFVWMIAVAVLYVALGAMGVWSKLNSNVGDLLTNNSAAELVSAGSIFGGAALVGLVNIVVLAALATLGAVIYNLSTDVVGGVEVTLADRD